MSKEKYNGETTLAKLIRNIGTWINDKVSKSTTVNGKALSTNIILSAEDVGALSVAETILFNGEASSGTVTLSEAYTNFKYLTAIGYTSSNNQNANSSVLIPVSDIDSSKRWVISHSGPLFLTFTSTTVIALDQAYNYSPKLMKIIGIK